MRSIVILTQPSRNHPKTSSNGTALKIAAGCQGEIVRARHQGSKKKKNMNTEAGSLFPLQNTDIQKLVLFNNDDLIPDWTNLPHYNKKRKLSLHVMLTLPPARDSNILPVSPEQVWMVGHDWVLSSSWEQDTQGRSGKMNSSLALSGPRCERVCMKLTGVISFSHNMFAQQNKSKGAVITL